VGLDWYDYGFRFYDPAIGRFPSLDPKADAFAELSPYNYASNNPVTMIDLWGLQGVDPNKDAQRQIWKGVGNVAFGSVGTVGSAIYIGGTNGLGAAAGGATAMVFSLGEIGVGMAQISDGVKALNNGSEINKSLENSSNLPGLIANVSGSENTELIDAAGGLLPGMLTGGNAKTVIEGIGAIKNSETVGQAIYNGLEVIDATLDLTNAGNAVIGSDNFGTGTGSPSSSSPSDYQPDFAAPVDNTKIVLPKDFNNEIKVW
jgi:hypothetical protein